MQLEKLDKSVLLQVHNHQKLKWLRLWKSGAAKKGEDRFPRVH